MQQTKDTTIAWQAPVDTVIAKRAEQRVIKQLLQALMFEDIIDYTHSSATNHNDIDAWCFTTMGKSGAKYHAQGHIHYSFDLIRFNSHDVQYEHDGHVRTATLEQVISDILLPIKDATLVDGFVKELRHTLLNEIQSQVLTPFTPKDVSALRYDELEGYLTAGHPYHPSFKSRLGFDLQDNFDFGPEFHQSIKVVWLAVHKDLLVHNSNEAQPISNWIADFVEPKHYADLSDKLNTILATVSDISFDADQYGLIPAHPWQWKNTLIGALHPLIANGEVIYLGATDSDYRAQQSIRTLAQVNSTKPYLKLSMHLINTSSTRILAKHTVMNGPVITGWLNELIENDSAAQDLNLALLGETVGVSLDHEVLQSRGYQHPQIYGGLAAIWRQNVAEYLAEDEFAFPLNGTSFVNHDGTNLIASWIEQHGVQTWVSALIEATVPPILHVLFGFGIALECHAQNIVLVTKQGLPQRILLKDLHDGVRYSPAHLTHPDLLPTLHNLPAAHAAMNRGSFIETDDTDGIRDMTVACLFFVALADIAIFMQTQFGFQEVEFWERVAHTVINYQQAHPEHEARFALFNVFAEKTRIESLAKRRLFGDKVFPIKFINNPLHKSIAQ